MSADIERHAVISDDGLYRYVLGRRWSDSEAAFATFIMLNPSTADAEVDDPTIVRCRNFAQDWGMGGLHVLNLYAFRATKPADLWKAAAPVGPKNDEYLTRHARAATDTGWPFVAAWGANAKPSRVAWVLDLPGMRTLSALGVTKGGQPRHPLYLRADSPLQPWRGDPS